MLTHHARLLRLAAPLILSNLTVALQGMVDTAVVGHIDTPAYIGAGRWLTTLMTDIELVRETVYLYLPWMMIAPIISVWCFLLDGIFIGATRGRELMRAMLFSTFIVYLPVWYLLQGLGNHGLWLALMAFFIARALSLLWYYRSAARWIA